jgi:hypothetical protein
MKHTPIRHSRVLTIAVALCALAFAGCAVQTESGEPSQTQTQGEEQAQGAGAGASPTSSGEPRAKAAEQGPDQGAAPAAKEQLVCKSARCVWVATPTQPQPWDPAVK